MNKQFVRMAGAAVAVTAAIVTAMSCSEQNTEGPSYIGPSAVNVIDGQMTPETLLSFGRLSDPQLSPDGEHIIYGVSYISIEENRSCRNLWICNVDGSDARPLTMEGKSISNARWLPDGHGIAYLQGGQIWTANIKDIDGPAPKLVKKAKESNIPNGISEFSFSPDFGKVIFISTIKAGAMTASDVNPKLDKANAYITEDLMYRHWDHWVTEVPRTYLAVFGEGMSIVPEKSKDLLEGENPRFELPTEPFGGIEQLCWSPDSRYIAYSCRKKAGKEYAFSTNTEIYIYDTITEKTTCVKAGGGYDTDPVWSPDGSRLAWLSMERDGYEADKTRLMVADLISMPDGTLEASYQIDLTADFKYNAAGPVWDEDSQHIYFNSLCEGLQGIFAASIDGSIERLTNDSLWYDFNSPFAVIKDEYSTTLLASWCSMDFPTELVAIPLGGEPAQLTSVNKELLDAIAPHDTKAVYVKTIDGKDMLTWVLYPPHFDSSKKYPAIEICLGGPQGTLSQGWSYRWNYRLMASQGYIVVLPNRRGTTAFGQDWCEQISGDYPGLNMQDYLCAANYIKSKPYVDKLAACGASYGGYSVYNLAGIHGDTYDCFVAHAGIFDERYMYYETEEMWFPNWDNGGLEEYEYEAGKIGPKGDGKTFGGMKQAGSPWSTSPKSVRHYASSPALNVTKWHTPILCIHGMMDYRIPYDQGMAAFNCAQMMGVPSKLVVFPEENHWILQPQNAILWHTEYFDWLDRWCK